MAPTRSSKFSVWLIMCDAVGAAEEDPLKLRLRAFGRMPAGWNHGEGLPVDVNVIRVAETFVETGRLLQLKLDVFPGLHGDCAVAFYSDDKCVEVVVRPGEPAKFDLHVEQGHGYGDFQRLRADDDVAHAEVVKEVVNLASSSDEWTSSASSHFASSTQSGAGFRTWFSSTPPDRRILPLPTAG